MQVPLIVCSKQFETDNWTENRRVIFDNGVVVALRKRKEARRQDILLLKMVWEQEIWEEIKMKSCIPFSLFVIVCEMAGKNT